MGACYSGEEEAKETTLAAPTPGQPLSVRLKKQGAFDADYDVVDLSSGLSPKDSPKWMLIDTKGGLFTNELAYYLKHRLEGQEESTVLGSAVIRNSDTVFDAAVEREHKIEVDFDSDNSDGYSDDSASSDDDYDRAVTRKEKIKAKFKFIKVAHLFADYDMTQHLGQLRVKAKGKYKRKTKVKTIHYTDEDGQPQQRTSVEVKHKTKIKKFCYRFEVMGKELSIECRKQPGSWRNLEWYCSDPASGAQMFSIVGDGRNANVRTNAGTDPSSTLLAAFAVACKFDPDEIRGHCEGACKSRI